MRWVKLTLPPRPRVRWLLITMRLSASSFAGTARTLVAVGTASEASMFCTIRAATPRSGTRFSVPAVAPLPVVVAAGAGDGVVAGRATGAGRVGAAAVTEGAGAGW